MIGTLEILHPPLQVTSHGMRFEFWKTADGAWFWHLNLSLGDILANGTPAASREHCLSAIKHVMLAAVPSQDLSAPFWDSPPLLDLPSDAVRAQPV